MSIPPADGASGFCDPFPEHRGSGGDWFSGFDPTIFKRTAMSEFNYKSLEDLTTAERRSVWAAKGVSNGR